MTTKVRITLICAAALAAAAQGANIYGGGGFAAWGDLETHYDFFGFHLTESEPLGASFWINGGFGFPVWAYRGAVSPGLELATDVGFGMKSKEGDEDGYLEGVKFSWKAVAVRENILFTVGFGPGGLVTPFVGFGGGVAIVPWSSEDIATGVEVDNNTEFKPALGIPFGVKFRVGPRLLVGMKADYLIILGGLTSDYIPDNVDVEMPNPFLFTATVGADL